MDKKTGLRYSIGLIVLVGLAMLSLLTGTRRLSLDQLTQVGSLDWEILWATRLPRTLAIIIAGASLSLAGLLAQQLTQNRFASPETLGTFASARLGLILSIFIVPGHLLLVRSAFAFVFALVGSSLFIRVIDRVQLKDSALLPVIGLVFSNVIQALGTYLAISQDISQEVNAWFQGSFASLHSDNVQLILISLLALIAIIAGAHYFSVLGLGRDMAIDLGLPFERVRLLALALIALATSSVLLTVGHIPFVGLVIPNLVTFFQGSHFQKNIGAVLLLGPIFLLACDLLARSLVAPYELPVSIIVGVVGSLIFIIGILKGEAA